MQNTEQGLAKDKDRALWRLLALARPEAKVLAIATLFLVLGSGMSLVYPQAVRVIVDQALGAKQLGAVNVWAGVLLAVSLIQAIAGSLRYYLFTLAGERTVLRLRERLYSRILDQQIEFFDFNRTGELMSRLSADCSVLQNAVSVNVSMGLRNLALAIGGFILLIYTSPRLALIVLVVVPPVAAFAGGYGRRIRGFSQTAQDALADASIVAEETISGIRNVRVFAQESFEKGRYARALDRALEAARSKIRQIAYFSAFATAFGYGAIAAVVWYGGRLIVSGEMTVGDLMQFLLYLFLVAFSVAALGSLWGDFMSALGAARRVFDILDHQPASSSETMQSHESLKGDIEFRGVGFSYPTRRDLPVLRDLSLHMKPGSTMALVGSSGSGKTTVASLLVRLYDPLDGDILIDGVSVRDLDPFWLRRHIGIVAQEPLLISASIEENIRYGKPGASREEVIDAAKIANAHDFISSFPDGYQTLVGERGIQLSGGQKQRVAIARAVLKNPEILILDEATSALDSESERLVQEALNRLMKGRTTLVIAHRLATIRSSDRILVLEKGRLIESGTHEELLANPEGAYHRLINKQFFHEPGSDRV